MIHNVRIVLFVLSVSMLAPATAFARTVYCYSCPALVKGSGCTVSGGIGNEALVGRTGTVGDDVIINNVRYHTCVLFIATRIPLDDIFTSLDAVRAHAATIKKVRFEWTIPTEWVDQTQTIVWRQAHPSPSLTFDGNAHVRLGQHPTLHYEFRSAPAIETRTFPVNSDLPVDKLVARALGHGSVTILKGTYEVDPSMGQFGEVIFNVRVTPLRRPAGSSNRH